MMSSLIVALVMVHYTTASPRTLPNSAVTGVVCGFTSTDFYYRAIGATYLGVVYSTLDHSNILTPERLQEIQSIELDIKSWPGYRNHSLIYREKESIFTAAFGEVSLYCEATPASPIIDFFPEVYEGNYIFTGEGELASDWEDVRELISHQSLWFSDEVYFDSDTFNEGNPESSFLVAMYPFGYMNGDETNDDLYAFVSSYDTMFNQLSDSDITVSFMTRPIHSDYSTLTDQQKELSIPDTVYVNDKMYERDVTPSSTDTPTMTNYTDCYSFGYSQNTGDSTGKYVVGSVGDNPATPSPIIQMQEICRETFWPRYQAIDDTSNAIYFGENKWNIMINGNDEYYCNVLLRDVSMCDGQWKDIDGSSFADLDIRYIVATPAPIEDDTRLYKNNAFAFNALSVVYIVIVSFVYV